MKRAVVFLAASLAAVLLGLVVGQVVKQRDDLGAVRAQIDVLAAGYEVARQTTPEPTDLPTAEEIIDGIEVPAPVPGPPGRDGRDGRNATQAMVDDFMARFPLIDHPDPDDPEIQDPEQQDPEQQDDEIQDPEVDDPEVQDPEIDDPDPDSNSCPSGYSWQPLVPADEDRLVCTRDPEPVP